MSKANTRVADLPENLYPLWHENLYLATDATDEKLSLNGLKIFFTKFFLGKNNNLSDVADKSAARNNLDVYSKDDIDVKNSNQDGSIKNNSDAITLLRSSDNIQNTTITEILAELPKKSNVEHTHSKADITNFDTEVGSIISGKISAWENVSVVERDGKIVIASTGWPGGWGDMLKSIYDPNNDWVVIDSEKLGWKLASYYAAKDDVDKNANDIAGKANDSDVVHKTGDETIDWVKIFKQPFNYQGNWTGDSIFNISVASDSWTDKPVFGYVKVGWTTDAPTDINIQNWSSSSMFSQRGYGLVWWVLGTYYDLESSIFRWFDGAYVWKVVEKTKWGSHLFRNTEVVIEWKSWGAWWGSQLHFSKDIEWTTNANIWWHIGGRSDYNDWLLFEYNSNATGAKQPFSLTKDGRILSNYYTNTLSRKLVMGSRYSISGIIHDYGGHNYQILWWDTANNAEGSNDDGWWGLYFGSMGNPYLKFQSIDTQLWRTWWHTFLLGSWIKTYWRMFIDARDQNWVDPVITLAIWDSDTGFNWNGDGDISMWTNNQAIWNFNTTWRAPSINLWGIPRLYYLSQNEYNNIWKDDNTLYFCY